MGWRERMLEAVPAWAAVLVSWTVLVVGWAVFAPDDKHAPWSLTCLALVLLMPAIGRTAHVELWRAGAFLASLVLAVVVSGWIGPFALWLLVVVVLTVPPTYWFVDRDWVPPWRSAEVGRED